MNQVPILVISDAPDQTSGLARVTRDLCTLLANMSEFRVATLGKYGLGSSRLPWSQYHMQADEWGERSLPFAWDDFSRGEAGIVLTIYDLTRLLWIARPEFVEDEWLRGWLLDARRRKFKVWSYVPVDATGPRNMLTGYSREVLLGVDRVLTYSPWAEGIVRNTIGAEGSTRRGLTWLPHGLNTRIFQPTITKLEDEQCSLLK